MEKTEKKELNAYAKLNVLRKCVHATVLRKNGNGYNYRYFELADFMPPALEKMAEIGLGSTFNLFQEHQTEDSDGVMTVVPARAVLTLVNVDDPNDTIEFESPVASMNPKGGNAIQAIGSMNTYFRRYLWLNALEICEHDEVDSKGEPDKPVEDKPVVKQAAPAPKVQPAAKPATAQAAPAQTAPAPVQQAEPQQPAAQPAPVQATSEPAPSAPVIEQVSDDDLPF